MEDNTENKSVEVVGIRFKDGGKIYYFDPDGKPFSMNQEVIVETAHGSEYGYVSTVNKTVPESQIVPPFRKIVREASEEDRAKKAENRKVEEKARKVWKEKIEEFKLDMDLVDVEYSFDCSKLSFFFISEKRIDFREFVKALAGVFKTRIELRQIGVRDEAKKIGGLGICGRPFCCSEFLNDFAQVSIKMAKEQNLSLNSTKISGTCGRLMCCLRYENEAYEEAIKITPPVDSVVETPDGQGVVTEANVLCGRLKVALDSNPENPVNYFRDQVKLIAKKRRRNTKEDNNSGEEQETGLEKD